MVTDGGVALARRHGDAAEGDAVEDDDIVADLGGLADDDARRMIDEDAAPDGGLGMNVHAGDGPGHGGKGARGGVGAVSP